MKTLNKKLNGALVFLAVLGILVVACKDDVLVPVNDTTQADSLSASISKLNDQLVTINANTNTITIQIAKVNNAVDSLNNAFEDNPRKIEYTVYLVNGANTLTSTNLGGRVKGVDNASVTIFAGGQTITATSNDGRVVFEGLGGGYATVQISATGFTPVTYQTYFFNDNRSAFGDGAVRVASTNILIFPTSGADAVTITGQLFANKSTLDDTLGRQFDNSEDGALYLKYISPPGISDFTNYTQNTDHDFSPYYNYYYNNFNSYDVHPNGTMVKYDPLSSLNGANIYGYPSNLQSSFTDDLDPNVPGQVLSITYTGMVSRATVDASTGKYTLVVPSYANFPGVNVSVEHYTDDHTFLTSENNVGSTKITINNFNASSYIATPVDFYKITSKWIYRASITQDDGTGSGIYSEIDYYEFNNHYSGYNITTAGWQGKPGAVITRNIYFYPTVPAL